MRARTIGATRPRSPLCPEPDATELVWRFAPAVLPRMPALTELRLPQNGIRPEGISELLHALGAVSTLEVLDLQDNTFTAVGSKALAEVLPKWPHMKTLNVGDCLLSAKVGCWIRRSGQPH